MSVQCSAYKLHLAVICCRWRLQASDQHAWLISTRRLHCIPACRNSLVHCMPVSPQACKLDGEHHRAKVQSGHSGTSRLAPWTHSIFQHPETVPCLRVWCRHKAKSWRVVKSCQAGSSQKQVKAAKRAWHASRKLQGPGQNPGTPSCIARFILQGLRMITHHYNAGKSSSTS